MVEQMPESKLDPAEVAVIRKGEENARRVLERLLTRCEELQRQIEVTVEFKRRRVELDEALKSLADDVNALVSKSSRPATQIMEMQENERRAIALKSRAAELGSEVESLKQSHGAASSSDMSRTETTVGELQSQLSTLLATIHQAVTRAQTASEEKAAIVERLSELASDAKLLYTVDDPAARRAQLTTLRVESQLLVTRLKRLEEDTESRRVGDEELLELAPVRANLEQIIALVDEGERTEGERDRLASIESRMAQEHQRIEEGIREAEETHSDTDGNERRLNGAISLLEGLNSSFAVVEVWRVPVCSAFTDTY
jgi:chromosome segregation ATPase